MKLNHLVKSATRVILAALFFLATPSWAASSNPAPLSDLQGHWILQPEFSDEFNGKSLDLTKWDNDVTDWGTWSWLPENAWLESGNLVLQMKYQEHDRKGHHLLYTSGIIKSKAQAIKYGYFETRIQAAPRFPGVSPSFWGYKQEDTIWTELDFVELTQRWKTPKQIDINTLVHRHPDFKEGQKIIEERTLYVDWDPRDAFHVYGVEWDADKINWYIDGALVGTRKNDYWHQSLDIVMSLGEKRSLRQNPSPIGFPTTAKYDYVRVWRKAE